MKTTIISVLASLFVFSCSVTNPTSGEEAKVDVAISGADASEETDEPDAEPEVSEGVPETEDIRPDLPAETHPPECELNDDCDSDIGCAKGFCHLGEC
ncbi:MAG: hypothetical protein AAB390_01970 [Patescibacteria group bacterium]